MPDPTTVHGAVELFLGGFLVGLGWVIAAWLWGAFVGLTSRRAGP